MKRTKRSQPILERLEDMTLLSTVAPLVSPGGAVVTSESFHRRGASTHLSQTVEAGSIVDSERFTMNIVRGGGRLAPKVPGYNGVDAENQFIRALDSALGATPPAGVLGTPNATVLHQTMTPTANGMVFSMELDSGTHLYFESYRLSSQSSGNTSGATPAVAFSQPDAVDDFVSELIAQRDRPLAQRAVAHAVTPHRTGANSSRIGAAFRHAIRHARTTTARTVIGATPKIGVNHPMIKTKAIARTSIRNSALSTFPLTGTATGLGMGGAVANGNGASAANGATGTFSTSTTGNTAGRLNGTVLGGASMPNSSGSTVLGVVGSGTTTGMGTYVGSIPNGTTGGIGSLPASGIATGTNLGIIPNGTTGGIGSIPASNANNNFAINEPGSLVQNGSSILTTNTNGDLGGNVLGSDSTLNTTGGTATGALSDGTPTNGTGTYFGSVLNGTTGGIGSLPASSTNNNVAINEPGT